jgi:hypothetical protein
MQTIFRLVSAAIIALVAACSSYSPALHDAPQGKSVVYEMPVERAQRIVLTVMSSHFAGREISPLPAPAIGYTTYTRMLLDTWSTTVTITPVSAKVDGRDLQAVRIETKGSGSSVVTGRTIFEGFKDRLKTELENTGSTRFAERYSIN